MSVVVVLGMHKSGTTLISKTLHHSGFCMGDFDEKRGYDQGNQYEHEDVLNLDFEVLNCAGQRSIDLEIKESYSWTDDHLKSAKNIVQSMQSHENWGFKEPRMALIYPLWQEALPDHKIIVVYRNPYEVLRHYGTMNRWARFKTLSVWCQYNYNILESIKGREAFVCSYHQFMTDGQTLSNLSGFLGKNLKDLRDAKMKRSRKCRKWPVLDSLFAGFRSKSVNQIWNMLEERSERN